MTVRCHDNVIVFPRSEQCCGCCFHKPWMYLYSTTTIREMVGGCSPLKLSAVSSHCCRLPTIMLFGSHCIVRGSCQAELWLTGLKMLVIAMPDERHMSIKMKPLAFAGTRFFPVGRLSHHECKQSCQTDTKDSDLQVVMALVGVSTWICRPRALPD